MSILRVAHARPARPCPQELRIRSSVTRAFRVGGRTVGRLALEPLHHHGRFHAAQRGVLFGCPIYVLEGERYATLYQDLVVLRLSPADVTDLISRGGRAFEPIKGWRSKDRIILPDEISANPRSLRAWVGKAVAYTRSSDS